MEAAVLVGNGPELMLGDLDPVFHAHPHKSASLSKEEDLNTFPSEGICLTTRLHAMEKRYIQTALKLAQGNESKAARLLGMNHHTFRYRKKKLMAE